MLNNPLELMNHEPC